MKSFLKILSSVFVVAFILFSILLNIGIGAHQYEKLENLTANNIEKTKEHISQSLSDDGMIDYGEYFSIQIRHSTLLKDEAIESLKKSTLK